MRRNHRRAGRIILAAWLALSADFAFAQKTTLLNLEEYQKKYPEENAIWLSKKETHTIKLEGSALKVYSTNYEEMLMLSEKGSVYADKSIYFGHFNKILSIDAKTLVPDGKGYKKIKVNNISTRNDVSGGVFFDDNQAKSFVYTGIQPGARTVLSYKEVLNEPRFFGSFFFNSYIPTVEAEFSVFVPKGVKIRYKLFGIEEKDLEFMKYETGKGVTYTWRAKNMKRYELENDAPNIRYYSPHVVVLIDEYTVKGETRKLLSDAAALYSWYYSLVKDVNTDESPALKKVVDSLTSGTTDEFEKVKKIFYWVQDNIKYVAFEDGLGGFIPRQAAQVCDKRYGDCKDMASIITEMLTMAGIQSHLTWIGSRDIPYTYDDVPAPLADNHMIAAYVKDGNYYFLDATGPNAPIEIHTAFIQGKEALVGFGENKFEIVKVPEIAKEKNLFIDSAMLKISDGKLSGTGIAVCSGYEKIDVSYHMKSMSEEDKLKFIKGYLEKGNNKFQVDSLQHFNLKDREKDLRFMYKFRLPDYLKVNGNELYLNMNLDKTYMNDLLDAEKRKVPREVEYKSIDRFVTVLEVPQGYSVTYLPANASYKSKYFGFEISYFQKDGKIYMEKTIYIDTLMITPADFQEWNKMIKALSKAYNESIILKKTVN
ncbi:MAG: DUF3857 domain-containing protein [Bacteroidota bacterium]